MTYQPPFAGPITCQCQRSGLEWCAPAAASLVPTPGRTGGSNRRD
jgi:hypothetical protein